VSATEPDGQFYVLRDGSRVPELPDGTRPGGYIDVIGTPDDDGHVIRVFCPWGAMTWFSLLGVRKLAREAAERFYGGGHTTVFLINEVTSNVGKRYDYRAAFGSVEAVDPQDNQKELHPQVD
jgi:hypothetical protein